MKILKNNNIYEINTLGELKEKMIDHIILTVYNDK